MRTTGVSNARDPVDGDKAFDDAESSVLAFAAGLDNADALSGAASGGRTSTVWGLRRQEGVFLRPL